MPKRQREEKRLRLSVSRSDKHIYAQIIDDGQKKTMVAASDLAPEIKKIKKGQTKSQIAEKVGNLLGEKAREKKIENVYFDKGDHKYHGRVARLAEGARKAGLNF